MAGRKKTEVKSSEASGKTVELKDKHTGFFDPVTGLKIVHNQRVKLGETVGKKTNRALLSGSLLIVSAEVPSPKSQGPKSEEEA